ncbi:MULTISPECIES: alpha/beta fold hydrolase [unclassified Crossiella]|uniref:alpha/beta fold hydrolase n=1 Tax=unclassified Crossiella TaxID=2620835 RepID=UPI002000336D|nr:MULTISPECIES: alpha/beta fold hydrolase [unclassified Crossiella]MCK2241829.1 alpha/beta fold hydrolase [Crossiella sp. S99.2]MCK2255732.1 alpha/beta fold hydrolase [Crossiella sp. S99.1]
MPLLDVAGGPLEYVVIDGRADLAPLVFLHHGVGSVAGWFRFHARIAAATGRRVLAYTRHGYGGSAPARLPRRPDYLDHEATVVLPEVLARLGIERPILIGHSDGAAIAVLYAAEPSRPVRGLALLAPLVFVEERTVRGIRSTGRKFTEGDLRAEVATIHADPDGAFLGWHDTWLSPEFRDWSVLDRLGRIGQPVLVVDGTKDKYATAAQGDAVCAGVAGPVSRVVVPDGMHMIHFSHPAETRAAVLDFLGAVDPEPAVERLDAALSAAAARFPDRPALAAGDEVLSYAELDRAVTELAGRLSDAGRKPGERLGVLLPKGIGAVIAIYAGLRLGLVVAPLDPADPAARIARMVRGAGIRFLLCGEQTLAKATRVGEGPALDLGGTSTLVPVAAADPPALGVAEDGGYILFTSGSTGWPKGVLLSHRNVLHFAHWAVGELGLGPADRIGSQSALGFDLSTFDLFATALAGACVDLMPDHLRLFPGELLDWLDQRRISVFYAVPSLYQGMLLHGEWEQRPPGALRLAVFAGEPFPPQYLERCLRAVPQVRFHNLYGPTETNVCTHEPVPPSWSALDGLSIGRAIPGDFVEVLDEQGLPTDGDGEIHVAGATVFLGYLVDGELLDPAREVRFRDGVTRRTYPTGDLGHFEADGRLHLRGRRDHQVKRHGHRIDLEDIESALLEVSDVDAAAVVLKSGAPHAGEIWAYVVGADSLTPQRISAALAAALPRRMLPDRVLPVAGLPVNQRGKLDRAALSERSA